MFSGISDIKVEKYFIDLVFQSEITALFGFSVT